MQRTCSAIFWPSATNTTPPGYRRTLTVRPAKLAGTL
jgi:hypothetical protein